MHKILGVSTYRWTPHKAENWGCPDTVDTNGLMPMSMSNNIQRPRAVNRLQQGTCWGHSS